LEGENRGIGDEESRMRDKLRDEVPHSGKGRIGEENLLYLYGIAAKLNIMEIIRSHKELVAYKMTFGSSMEIFHLTKSFPKEEVYSLTSQIR
jgi:hypothetical protein